MVIMSMIDIQISNPLTSLFDGLNAASSSWINAYFRKVPRRLITYWYKYLPTSVYLKK